MSKKKHLTLDDRIVIEERLKERVPLHRIAKELEKADTSIAREIMRNRYPIVEKQEKIYYCKHYFGRCTVMHLCDADCNRLCAHCYGYCNTNQCKDYTPKMCPNVEKAPYVCNGCKDEDRKKCEYPRYKYSASKAHMLARDNLRYNRMGVTITQDEMEIIDNIVSPLLLKGQSIRAIYKNHSDQLPVSERTLYNYVDNCYLTARNIDMPRKVRYKARYSHSRTNIEANFLIGRRYKDFNEYINNNPDTGIVEMDTVIGGKNSKKVLLTLIFRNCHFMIAILLPDKRQVSVINALNELYEIFGHDKFKKLFGVILTDRGTEFSNPFPIEVSADNRERTKVFYCDAYSSCQKGMIEKNHEFIRYILPQGRSFDRYTQADITLMMNHINNYPRASLNDATPYELAKHLIGTEILHKLHYHKIRPDDVILKPSLLQNNYH